MGACVIAFSLANVAPNTAEAFVNNAGKYSSQDVRSMEIGANQVKHNGRDSLATELGDTVFGLSCGLLVVYLLRMSNKR